jgi:hypothetical protein
MEKKEARKVINKMIEIAGLDSQGALAKILGGISSQSISGAIAKGKLPQRWYEIMEEKFGVKQADIDQSAIGITVCVDSPNNPITKEEDLIRRDRKLAEKYGKYEILITKFQSVFDFVIDTYQGDAFAVDTFLEKMRNDFLKKDPDYLQWQYAKQAKIDERLKKRTGEDYPDGFVEKKFVNR